MKRLKLMREERGWTQGKVGRLSGLSQSTISKLELGDMRVGMDSLKTLAGMFEVSVEMLMCPLGVSLDRAIVVNGLEHLTSDNLEKTRDYVQLLLKAQEVEYENESRR